MITLDNNNRVLDISLPKISEKLLLSEDLGDFGDSFRNGIVDFVVHSLKTDQLYFILLDEMAITAVLQSLIALI